MEMAYSREQLRTMKRNETIRRYVSYIVSQVLLAAGEGKSGLFCKKPYNDPDWEEYLPEVLEKVMVEFPDCDISSDDQHVVTIRWD